MHQSLVSLQGQNLFLDLLCGVLWASFVSSLSVVMERPQVLVLPFPLQGHIKPMLNLAKLLCRANFQVTFINSDYNQERLLQVTSITDFSTHFPGLHFESISDGLPPDHPRVAPTDSDLFFSTRSVTKPLFRELVISIVNKSCQTPPIACIIADGFMSFAIDVAEEFTIPVFCFHTQSAYSLWAYLHIPNLIKQGVIPFQGDKNLDKPITSIPGLDEVFRFRDLPNICRFEDVNDPVLQFFLTEVLATVRASGLIINTFDDFESPVISKLSPLFPKIYTVGPLHTLLKSRMKDLSIPSMLSNGNLAKEDRSCMTWLDSQPLRSVIYVSFGSLVGLTSDQLLEFWHGLVDSGKPFLWAVRHDFIVGLTVGQIPVTLQNGTKDRGCLVDWAPQDEVLAHPAVGGFLTHSGWNSTLESIVSTVPMICWPIYADQQVNSRCVSHVWGIGLDMKDTCDRKTVEEMVKDLIDGKRTEKRRSLEEFARMAHESIQKGGSSYCNLEMLIEYIQSMGV